MKNLKRMLVSVVLALIIVALPFAGQAEASHKKVVVHHQMYACGSYYVSFYFATGNMTAGGHWPWYGEVAVDTNMIRMGDHVVIYGVGTFVADDTGGAVWGQHIDVFIPNDDWNWGYSVSGPTQHRQVCAYSH